ncbi:MAG: AAA-associated domain-containing protein [Candidatus Micrarchaeota archaeon]|nr:AAA-associated domain-containing protein [Candidatus Micrarchaeota archaeon]
MGAGISRVRAIVNIIKEFGGSIEISRLAEESRTNIDSLLPLIEASNQLGFTKIVESEIKLTQTGAKLNIKNSSALVKEGLQNLEPFKTTKKILEEQHDISSKELFDELSRRGHVVHGDRVINDMMLKKVLIRWGVRSKMFRYSTDTDMWSLANS